MPQPYKLNIILPEYIGISKYTCDDSSQIAFKFSFQTGKIYK